MSKLSFPALKLIDYTREIIAFEIPTKVYDIVQARLADWAKRKMRYFRVDIQPPMKPITTGMYSQMNRIYGHISWISLVTDQDIDSLKIMFKHLATPGYPFDIMHDAKTERDIVAPWSLTRVNTKQAAWLCDVIVRWAGEEQIPLPEYAEDGSVVLL